MRIRIFGIGMGPQHVTAEVAEALRAVDYVVAAAKSDDDPLLAVRRQICDAAGVPLLAVPDPERDRADPADYAAAVRDWHAARVAAYRSVFVKRGGTAAFLVWGDPSLYDSTIRVVSGIAETLPLEYDVLPGISAPQLLAARHRIVLHEVGRAVHLTAARLLRADIEAGNDNLVVMLTSGLDLDGLDGWQVWWGANLGAPGEQLVAGRVADVRDDISDARARAKASDGWVMDLALLRAP